MDPGLLSGSGAGRGLPWEPSTGLCSRKSFPFFKRQPPHAPGFSRFTASPDSASVPGKAVQNSSLPPAPFFLAMGLSSDNGAAGLGPDWPGPLWLSFSSFPDSQLHLRPPGSLPGQKKAYWPWKTAASSRDPGGPWIRPDRRAGPDPSGDPEALMIRSILSQPSPALRDPAEPCQKLMGRQGSSCQKQQLPPFRSRQGCRLEQGHHAAVYRHQYLEEHSQGPLPPASAGFPDDSSGTPTGPRPASPQHEKKAGKGPGP